MKCRFMRHSLRYPGAFGSLRAILVSGLTSGACLRPAKFRSQRGLGQAGGAAESGEVTLSRTGNSGGIGFQSQRFELAATPIGVQVSQAFDVEAARQSTLYRCPDQLGREKGKGECQIDLTRRTSLALGQLLGAVTEPYTISSNHCRPRAMARLSDETDPPFGAVRPAAGHRGAVGVPICCSNASRSD